VAVIQNPSGEVRYQVGDSALVIGVLNTLEQLDQRYGERDDVLGSRRRRGERGVVVQKGREERQAAGAELAVPGIQSANKPQPPVELVVRALGRPIAHNGSKDLEDLGLLAGG
jgi:hypothetical protein